ncbi:hypothetical protein, partial [Peribacillus frigoritolerans]|uniref:hypothetical protein n=1 Tax=Peribacillus frigoritolerans TaxID=450367 RepID=UPI00202476AE
KSRLFYARVEITNFVEFLIPLSVILMGFSLLYTGYQLIFQKKLDREAIIVNVFMIMFFFALIQEGMEKANQVLGTAIHD